MTRSISMQTCVVHDYDEAYHFFMDALRFIVVEDMPSSKDNRGWLSHHQSRGVRLCRLQRRITRAGSGHNNQIGDRVSLFLDTSDFWDDYGHMHASGVRFAE